VVKDSRRATRRQFSAEDKIRIVLNGLRGEDSIAKLCRREGIIQSVYSSWSKEFIEAVCDVWLVTQPVPPPVMRFLIYARKQARSRNALRI
jgi:hypothetical protein